MKRNKIIIFLCGMLLIVALFTWLDMQKILQSDVLSNTVGTLAGGVLSICLFFGS